MKSKRLILAFALGLVLMLALLVGLSSSSQTARAWPPPGRTPGPAFVKAGQPTSGASGYCYQNDPCGSIQYAVDQSETGNGDTIYVTGGTFTSTEAAIAKITKSISIYGGWDGNPSGVVVRNPISYPTTLDGEDARRVVYITGTVAPMLEGLTLQRGNASGLGGDPVIVGGDFGGAVYANGASPIITNCRIVSSTAGFGGGLALYYGTPTVGNSEIVSNTASQVIASNLRGVGGGILLYQSAATIEGNVISRNVASGTQAYDGGGGLYLDTSPALVRGNIIKDNHANPLGAGLYIYNSAATLRDNAILGNRAASYGGGAYMLLSPTSIESNLVMDNFASTQGGGLDIWGCAPFTLTNNVFANNHTLSHAPAIHVQGYQQAAPFIFQSSQGTLLHNTFAINHAALYPWMIHVGSGVTTPNATLVLTNTIFEQPGGIFVDQVGAVTLDTTLWHPTYATRPGDAITGTGIFISSTNYYSNPTFVGPTFHIAPNSPAVDLGANAGVSTDLDGESRPNGLGPDIGADEFYCYGLTDVSIAGPTTIISGTACTLTATVSPETATQFITYTWQASGQPPTTHTVYSNLNDTAVYTWTITGPQYVTVTTTNCGGSAVGTRSISIYLPPTYLPLVLRDF